MSRQKPVNPRPKRFSRRAKDSTESDGIRIRLRLAPADAAALEALLGEGEDASQAIRRLIRTAALQQPVLDRLSAIESRLDGMALAPAPTSAVPEGGEGEAEAQGEPDAVTAQKAAIASFLGADDDDDDEDDG